MEGEKIREQTRRQLAAVKVNPDVWIDADTVCVLRCISPATLYRRLKSGEIPAQVAKGRWRGGDIVGVGNEGKTGG